MNRLIRERPILSVVLAFALSSLVTIGSMAFFAGVHSSKLATCENWIESNKQLPARMSTVETRLDNSPRLLALEKMVDNAKDIDRQVSDVLCKIMDRLTNLEILVARHTGQESDHRKR